MPPAPAGVCRSEAPALRCSFSTPLITPSAQRRAAAATQFRRASAGGSLSSKIAAQIVAGAPLVIILPADSCTFSAPARDAPAERVDRGLPRLDRDFHVASCPAFMFPPVSFTQVVGASSSYSSCPAFRSANSTAQLSCFLQVPFLSILGLLFCLFKFNQLQSASNSETGNIFEIFEIVKDRQRNSSPCKSLEIPPNPWHLQARSKRL